jgi:hypothetical protein
MISQHDAVSNERGTLALMLNSQRQSFPKNTQADILAGGNFRSYSKFSIGHLS